jgi:hypothetical protein
LRKLIFSQKNLSNFVSPLENSITGIAIILRQSVIKPRIKPWVDTFPSHDITEDTFADYEANDPFVQTFIMNLDSLLGKIFYHLSIVYLL